MLLTNVLVYKIYNFEDFNALLDIYGQDRLLIIMNKSYKSVFTSLVPVENQDIFIGENGLKMKFDDRDTITCEVLIDKPAEEFYE